MHASLRTSLLALVLPSPVLAQATTRVSVDAAGAQANQSSLDGSISGDGRYVAFRSLATNLVASDTNGTWSAFRKDLLSGQVLLLDRSSAGVPGNGAVLALALSGDGSRAVFLSGSTNLVAADSNGVPDVFVRDLASGATTRIDVTASGAQISASCYDPAISADGRFAAFCTDSPALISGDTNLVQDVFVRDLQLGLTDLVSTSSGGGLADGASAAPALSQDGRYVAFMSLAGNLVPTDANGQRDVFVKDRQTWQLTRVSVDSAGIEGNGESFQPSISADGNVVAFASWASNLVAGDTNAAPDIFVHELSSGLTTRVSVSSAGAQADLGSSEPTISADGRYVSFLSSATNLVAGDSNLQPDVFVHDRLTGNTRRVNVNDLGAQCALPPAGPRIAGNGRMVVFSSADTHLVGGDTNATDDVFVRFPDSAAQAFCFGDGSGATPCPCANPGFLGNGCENSAGTGGANLSAFGVPVPDTMRLDLSGALPSVLSIFLQGNADLATPATFGDGVRCVGGALKRLYVKNAVAGACSAPTAGETGLRARAAELGDVIASGTTRSYQVYYRDPSASFCSAPQGNTWNVSNGVRIAW